MKTILFTFIVIGISTFSSCKNAGGDKLEKASIYYNTSGILVSKTPSDYDRKYGYEVLVYEEVDSFLLEDSKVFIPLSTWEKIPVPNDSTRVIIEYISDIAYGAVGGPDLQIFETNLNLATGFTIENIQK